MKVMSSAISKKEQSFSKKSVKVFAAKVSAIFRAVFLWMTNPPVKNTRRFLHRSERNLQKLPTKLFFPSLQSATPPLGEKPLTIWILQVKFPGTELIYPNLTLLICRCSKKKM